MRIFVTNDDGIEAKGIILLAKTAMEFGEVTVVAPREQCSAMSHHITLRDKMHIEKVDFPVEGVKAYAMDATPADCVRASFLGLMDKDELPDIVFSGINRGANCGFDILYSATVGAAMEAVLYNIPAICFSQNFFPDDPDYHEEVMEAHIRDIMAELITKKLPDGTIFNVNFPSCSIEDYKGVKYDRVPARTAFWDDNYDIGHKIACAWSSSDAMVPYGKKELRLTPIPVTKAAEGTDIRAILDGYISVGTLKNFVL
ncbi:5'/3'-nucleotidase SurE [Butyrivibrio sp. MC2013]|uniref:5'/3'-nucleotidase SurE n=1 Tax=Butyrivibrio sp. MC2013 TaxID=1280686 RepID=UPI0004021AC2|nr:5'/3'-nucleotidase SurE [Butyrivibrio sp. MC2013]